MGGAVVAVTIILVIAPVVGFCAAVVSHAVPDTLVREQLVESIERDQLNAADYGQAVTGKQIDYFSDCLAVSVGLPDEGSASPIRSAIATTTGGGCSATVPAVLIVRDGGVWTGGYDYYRYWHGYTTVTRPGIAAFGLAGLRVLALVALAGATIGLGRSLGRAHGWATPFVMLAPLVLTTDFIELPRSLPHAAGAVAAVVGAWFAHRRTLVRGVLGEVAWVSSIAGVLYVYVDLLTMPPGAVVLLVGAVGLASAQHATGRRLGLGMLVALGAWLAGWIWMWVAKWLIASVVFGVGTVYDVIRFTAENRLDGNADAFDFSFLATSRTMLVTWRNQPLTTVLMTVLVVAVVVVVVRRRLLTGRVGRLGDRVLLALPAAFVFVWFEVMRNHSQNHGFFTYRSLAIAAGLVLAAGAATLPACVVDDAQPTLDDHDA